MTDKQIKFEEYSRDEAKRRFDKDVTKAIDKSYYSSTKAGRHTIHAIINTYADALEAKVEAQKTKLVSRNNYRAAYKEMEEVIIALGGYEEKIGVYKVASFALKTIFDAFAKAEKGKLKVAATANKIGSALDAEMQMLYYYDEMPEDIAKSGKRKAKDPLASPKHRRSSPVTLMKNMALRQDVQFNEYLGLTDLEQNQVGMFLIELACELGILDNKNVIKNKKQEKMLFTTKITEELNDLEFQYRSRALLDLPLKETPIPWKNQGGISRHNFTGGGHTEFVRLQNRMCRGFFTDTKFGVECIDLLNRLQAIPWKIDNSTYEVAKTLMSNHISVDSFQAMPDKPVDLQVIPGLSDDEVQVRKYHKFLEHQAHQNLMKQYFRTNAVMEVAKEYEFDGEIYYSWSCDWRGRLYPIPNWLQIQGCDFERSLLQFREGCELNKVGKMWAARAVGGSYLGSSSSYQEREDWTKDNKEFIKTIAHNPLSTIGDWEGAKEPWSFLQLCMEWTAVVLDESKSTWNVPVGVDSTASGLQLLSAMRRDELGMRYANLLPSTKNTPPLDAYKRVLELAKEMVKDDKSHLLPYLEYRKVGKPALMLSIYGGSFPTIRDAIKDFFKDNNIEITQEDVNDVAKTVMKASKATFPEAYKALDWLKKLAGIAFKKGSEKLTWETPTGDSIDLNMNEKATLPIYTETMGKTMVCVGETEIPDISSMKNSFAPSFVHSYDAALVKAAFHDWDRPIALIHDCVRLLPVDMNLAIAKIKTGFKRVCSGNPLNKLADDLGVTEEELPRLTQGDDSLLSQVDKSVYMFN